MHAISSYRGNRPTNKQTGLITICCAAKLSAQCNYNALWNSVVKLLTFAWIFCVGGSL